MAAYTEFTLWLVPAEPLRTSLRAIVGRLAASLHAVEFEPHVTLFCGASTEGEAREAARSIALEFAPLELKAERLDHSDSYTKFLFVQFHDSPQARRMFETAASRFAKPSKYSLNPHLSLAYKKEPAAFRQTLCDTLETPKGAYAFDRIRMIETELPIENDGPVRRWRTVCDEPLSGTTN